MKNYFEKFQKIKERIRIEILRLLIIHINTKGTNLFHQKNITYILKLNLYILNSISRVSAQKMIMKVLKMILKLKYML